MYAVASGVEEPFKWQYVQLLVLRVIELTQKAIYKLQRLIGGPLSRVWGYWLDIVGVIVGIGESWIDLLLTDKCSAVNTKSLAYLRALRLPRLARVLKIARVMLTRDASWAQGRRFQCLVLSVIGFNNPLMGLECNIPDSHYCWILEVGLLCIYIFVLVMLMRVSGGAFFCNCTWCSSGPGPASSSSFGPSWCNGPCRMMPDVITYCLAVLGPLLHQLGPLLHRVSQLSCLELDKYQVVGLLSGVYSFLVARIPKETLFGFFRNPSSVRHKATEKCARGYLPVRSVIATR